MVFGVGNVLGKGCWISDVGLSWRMFGDWAKGLEKETGRRGVWVFWLC
jgi:hypothetical protein